jgi:hypothetical protein
VPFGRRELGTKTQRTVGLAPADNSRHHPAVVVGSRLALSGPGPRDRRRGDPVADETDCRLCQVEHDLLGLSSWQLASVHRALGEAVRREIRQGIPYSQRIYVPEEQRSLCLFEAAGPEAVRAVNDIAHFPLARVIAVLSAVPDETSPMAGLAKDSADEW